MKTLKLKADNLLHIMDHGPAVVFEDSRLNDLVKNLFSSSGEKVKTITAGKSRLRIWRTSPCVFFLSHWNAVANCTFSRIAYYSPAENILDMTEKTTSKNTLGDTFHGKSLLEKMLWCSCTGASLPRQVLDATRPGQPATPEFFKLLQNQSWALLGETGLRSWAIAEQCNDIDIRLRSAKRVVESAKKDAILQTRRLRYTNSQIVEDIYSRYSPYLNEAREHLSAEAAQQQERVEKEVLSFSSLCLDSMLAVASNSQSLLICRLLNAAHVDILLPHTGTKAQQYLFRPAQTSPAYSITNHIAKADSEGNITLSSGIVCPFKVADVIAWLQGGEPIVTRYGKLTLSAATDVDKKPFWLFSCGCHRIRADNISAIEAELAKRKLPPVVDIPALDSRQEADREMLHQIIVAACETWLATSRRERATNLLEARKIIARYDVTCDRLDERHPDDNTVTRKEHWLRKVHTLIKDAAENEAAAQKTIADIEAKLAVQPFAPSTANLITLLDGITALGRISYTFG